jgi:hypothetical protein
MLANYRHHSGVCGRWRSLHQLCFNAGGDAPPSPVGVVEVPSHIPVGLCARGKPSAPSCPASNRQQLVHAGPRYAQAPCMLAEGFSPASSASWIAALSTVAGRPYSDFRFRLRDPVIWRSRRMSFLELSDCPKDRQGELAGGRGGIHSRCWRTRRPAPVRRAGGRSLGGPQGNALGGLSGD